MHTTTCQISSEEHVFDRRLGEFAQFDFLDLYFKRGGASRYGRGLRSLPDCRN